MFYDFSKKRIKSSCVGMIFSKMFASKLQMQFFSQGKSVGIICSPLHEIWLRRLPQLGGDQSPCFHAHRLGDRCSSYFSTACFIWAFHTSLSVLEKGLDYVLRPNIPKKVISPIKQKIKVFPLFSTYFGMFDHKKFSYNFLG